MAAKKRLLSGIQPSGQLHIGNYLGAMRQFVLLQDTYDSYISIVNLHALTTVRNPEVLRKHTLHAAIDHLAIGLDPKKVTLFVQSDIPQLTELTWIFNTLVTVPYLSRAHAYKDKIGQGLEATAGLFDYPVLMAADILLPDTDVVPVGADQKQHVEIARDIAEKFNTTFGETFQLPEAMIQDDVATIPGTDGRKMSKSYGNTIPLFASDAELKRTIMSIVTDSKGAQEPKNPETDTVFALHRHFSSAQLPEIAKGYQDGSLSYQESKELLFAKISEFVTPFRERRDELMKDLSYVHDVLEEGGKKMRTIAEEKMVEVRKKVGTSL